MLIFFPLHIWVKEEPALGSTQAAIIRIRYSFFLSVGLIGLVVLRRSNIAPSTQLRKTEATVILSPAENLETLAFCEAMNELIEILRQAQEDIGNSHFDPAKKSRDSGVLRSSE